MTPHSSDISDIMLLCLFSIPDRRKRMVTSLKKGTSITREENENENNENGPPKNLHVASVEQKMSVFHRFRHILCQDCANSIW